VAAVNLQGEKYEDEHGTPLILISWGNRAKNCELNREWLKLIRRGKNMTCTGEPLKF
jgi:hypothetical protein